MSDDKMTFRFEQDVLPVPSGCTAELEDGTVVEGPALVTSEWRVIPLDAKLKLKEA